MPRLERPVSESSNPAKKFLEWKSTEKAFQYYDKSKESKIKVDLPLKVLFLEHYHTIKGWSDSANSGIWSNEVYSIAKESLEVKSKSGTIVNGIYKDNKNTIKNTGGVYHRSVYCMAENGEIINLQLKGAAIGGLKKDSSIEKLDVDGYSDFYKKNHHLLDNQWIEIKSIKEGKKGSVKFSIPHFEIGEAISREDDIKANYAASELQRYINAYFSKESVEDVVSENKELALEDLDL